MNVMRQLSVLIWNDDKFPSLSDDEQLVFFHLLTTPLTTTFGLFKAGVHALSEEKRWKPERYHRALSRLVELNMVRYDGAALMFYFPRALKYNPPANPNVLKSWSDTYHSLPNSPLKREFYTDLKSLIEQRNKEGLLQSFIECFGDGSDFSADDSAPVGMEFDLVGHNPDMRLRVTGDERWQ